MITTKVTWNPQKERLEIFMKREEAKEFIEELIEGKQKTMTRFVLREMREKLNP